MRLTADVLLHAENYLNAYRDREVNLRGLKIPAIENLSVLQDQYDVIDLSDNDIKKLDNFPMMSRLSSLLLNNNSIIRVAPQLGDHLPRLQALVLTNNKISYLYEVDHIASLKKLDTLSLMENPVTLQANYRAYVIHKIPQLRTLDFTKISKKERDDARTLFSSPPGKLFLANVQQERAIYISSLEQKRSAGQGSGSAGGNNSNKVVQALTEDQRRQVKEAIEKASTKEEIDLIEYQLKTGSFVFTDITSTAINQPVPHAPLSTAPVPPAPKSAAVLYSDMEVID